MSEPHPSIIVDTNILFSALLREPSLFVELLFQSEFDFYICEYVIIELFKHKDRLVKQSKLSEDDVLRLFYRVMKRLHIYPERLIAPEFITEAQRLCASVDANDSIHIALTLALGGQLWTGDYKLMDGLKRQGVDIFFIPPAARER